MAPSGAEFVIVPCFKRISRLQRSAETPGAQGRLRRPGVTRGQEQKLCQKQPLRLRKCCATTRAQNAPSGASNRISAFMLMSPNAPRP